MLSDYHLLVESVKDYAIFMLDTSGRIISWNKGAERLKGYSQEEAVGRHFSIFYSQEDKDDGKPQRELEIAIKEGKYEEEGWRIRKDGSRFWANVTITTAHNEANELVGFAKVTRDLTEKRRSEELYLLLIEQVKEYAIYMLDESGHILTWNKGGERIKGYSVTEILGKHFSVFYCREDIDSNLPGRGLQQAIQTGQYTAEGWRIRKDGSKFWASITITPVYTDKHIGFAKVVRDLTERREAEKVNKAHDLLEVTNKELERFAYIVSHDLKEPLRKITTFANLLLAKEEDNLSALHKKYTNKIMESSSRLSTMIEDILDFSSLSEKPEFEKYSLQKISDEVIDVLETSIKGKNAVINTDNLPETIIIPAQMKQLFQNLIANSLKFSRSNVQPVINISHTYVEKERVTKEVLWPTQQYLQVSFSDNGIGFDPAYAEQIFHYFTKLHGKSEYEGSGLGLAICKKIVDNHGGAILADSKQGEGAIFRIVLPVL